MIKRNLLLFSVLTFLHVSLQAQQAPSPDQALKQLKWRSIGPANMGGRVTDIEGIPGDPTTFYVGGADGGIFKTTNGGVTMEAIFDNQKSFSIGEIAIAPSDREVLYVGTGEGDPRNSVGYGHGVYRSNDAGKTWQHLGLEKTDRIKRIVINPQDPDMACVCAMGREWGPNTERGVFRTVDGGKTWDKVLYIDENTGCSDIAIEWNNPRIMYAGMWTFRRRPWRFDDSGEKTGLYKTIDGGKTWTKISHKNGMPDKPMARIGISIAQSQPNTLFVITEFKDGGTLFRSDDRGENWKLVNSDRELNFRPFYYSDVKVDPANADHLYTLSGGMSKSTDGGKTFFSVANGQHGDNQALWIDPKNSNRVLSGDDGGFRVSYDGFKTFMTINNVELAQFYQLYLDNQEPYKLYGGLQDNGTWTGPSNSLYQAGILKKDWKQIAYGDGYYAVPIPGQEHEIYANSQGGVIYHVDTGTGNTRIIHPYPNRTGSAGDAIENHTYRFNWDSPILVSPNDPNTVYTAGNVLFKSKDKGYTWEQISPDLTTNDKSKQKSSGGEIYQDNTAAEFHCTIISLAESPLQKDVLWAGTDDGNVQVTRDGGKTWTNVKNNIVGLPAAAWISKIHASEHDAGTAFIAVDQHRMDDYKAYAFMTTDFGKTWTKISNGLPEDWCYVVRQDPHQPNLLFAGMEHGVFASWDKGKSWTKINNNLPPASVRDLRIHKRDHDLVVATHGRGLWIFDDMQPLRELATVAGKEAAVFPVRPAILWNMYPLLEEQGDMAWQAKNPPYGAYINMYLQKDPKEAITIDIMDIAGNKVRTIKDTISKAGVNRIVWDLRYQEAEKIMGAVSTGWGSGAIRPYVAPGTYTVVVKANGQQVEAKIIVRGDPRINLSEQDYKAKTETALALREQLAKTHKLINRANAVNKQLGELKQRIQSNGETPETNKALLEQIDNAQKAITQFEDDILRRPAPDMGYRQYPRLKDEIAELLNAVNDAVAKPTQPQLLRLDELKQETQDALNKFEQIVTEKIVPINEKTKNLPSIIIGDSNKKL